MALEKGTEEWMKFEETNETVKEASEWKSINDDNPFS